MKGLKIAAILGVVFFASNASALKLKIVKKSAAVGHSIVDQADLDSNATETSLRDQFDRYDSDDNSFDSIKTPKKVITVKRQTATYMPGKKTVKKVEVESLIEENDISNDLPAESVSDEQTVKQMKKSIKDEFEDEISMAEELEDQNSINAVGMGY